MEETERIDLSPRKVPLPKDALQERVILNEDTYRMLRSKAMTADRIAKFFGRKSYHTSDLIKDIEALEGDETPEPLVSLAELMQDWQAHISVDVPEDVTFTVPPNYEGPTTITVSLSDELKEVLDRVDLHAE